MFGHKRVFKDNLDEYIMKLDPEEVPRIPMRGYKPPSEPIIPIVPTSDDIKRNEDSSLRKSETPVFDPLKHPSSAYEGCEYVAVFGLHEPRDKERVLVFLTVPEAIKDLDNAAQKRRIERIRFSYLPLSARQCEDVLAEPFALPPKPDDDPRLQAAMGTRSLERVISEKRLFCYYSVPLARYVPDWEQRVKPLRAELLNKYFPIKPSQPDTMVKDINN